MDCPSANSENPLLNYLISSKNVIKSEINEFMCFDVNWFKINLNCIFALCNEIEAFNVEEIELNEKLVLTGKFKFKSNIYINLKLTPDIKIEIKYKFCQN